MPPLAGSNRRGRHRRGAYSHSAITVAARKRARTNYYYSPALTSVFSSATTAIRFGSTSQLLLSPSLSILFNTSVISNAISLSRLLALFPNDLPQLLSSSSNSSNSISNSSSFNCKSTAATTPPPPWFLRLLSASSSFSSSTAACADKLWFEAFRMHKKTFFFLLEAISPCLREMNFPPDRVLGAALFRLAHAASFSLVAYRFGLPNTSTAMRAFYVVVRAVIDRLGGLMEMSSENLQSVADGFGELDLPNCRGALGFTRFLVTGNGGKKGSIIVQTVVDLEGRFLGVSAGWPGSMKPSDVLIRTNLYSERYNVLDRHEVVKLDSRRSSVPPYFLGNSCCPLLPWLLTPFRKADSGVIAPEREAFNNAHSQGMAVVERAFGQLRARWKLLATEWKEDCVAALPFVVISGCLLHNFLIKCSETVADFEGVAEMAKDGFEEFDIKGDKGGERVRDVLASHISNGKTE